MQLFNSPYLIISYDEHQEILLLHWTGQITSEQYKSGYEAMYKIVAEKNISNWLIDGQLRGLPSPEDEDWWYNRYYNKIKETVPGPIRVAVVINENDYQNMIHQYNLVWGQVSPEYMSINYFTSMEEAMHLFAYINSEEEHQEI